MILKNLVNLNDSTVFKSLNESTKC